MKSRAESSQATQSKALLQRACGEGTHQNHYIAGYQAANGRQLALERFSQGFYLWSEPCLDKLPPAMRAAHRRSYAADEPRNADLNGKTAGRLLKGNRADYWRFDTLGELQAFINWNGKL